MDTIKFSDLPPLRDPLEGGTFAGLITLADGRHCAVVLLKERPEQRLTWAKAMDWARSVGGQLVSAGVLLWMFGLLALDVPADLPHWRHIAGAALLACAVHLWRRASIDAAMTKEQKP